MVLASAPNPVPAVPHVPLGNIEAKTSLVDFETAPFPYHGTVPGSNRQFLDAGQPGQRGHVNFRGRMFLESKTFGDDRVLLHIPQGFDPNRPAVMVVFFHGHGATLERDVRDRQRLPDQISAAGHQGRECLGIVAVVLELPDPQGEDLRQGAFEQDVFDVAAGELLQGLTEAVDRRRARQIPFQVGGRGRIDPRPPAPAGRLRDRHGPGDFARRVEGGPGSVLEEGDGCHGVVMQIEARGGLEPIREDEA